LWLWPGGGLAGAGRVVLGTAATPGECVQSALLALDEHSGARRLCNAGLTLACFVCAAESVLILGARRLLTCGNCYYVHDLHDLRGMSTFQRMIICLARLAWAPWVADLLEIEGALVNSDLGCNHVSSRAGEP
jgi:hypothetical protein